MDITDLSTRPLTRVVDLTVADGKTNFRFEQQRDTGIDGDVVLNLESGKNKLMWAFGKCTSFYLFSVSLYVL